MIEQDYAEPSKGNALTGFGYLLRVAAKLAVALLITIILGIQLP